MFTFDRGILKWRGRGEIMFEKEDFEKYMKYSKDYYDCREPMTERKLYQLWKDGAELGYNKAANEWNFIKEGKFPAENTECLCIIRPNKENDEPFGNKDFRAVLYYRNGRFLLEENDDNEWLRETNSDFTDLVIAWKEIVLPKMDDWYVSMSAYGEHVIRRECSKNAMYKGTYEECEKWIERKNLNLFTRFRKQFGG